jgi:hypothetical protein
MEKTMERAGWRWRQEVDGRDAKIALRRLRSMRRSVVARQAARNQARHWCTTGQSNVKWAYVSSVVEQTQQKDVSAANARRETPSASERLSRRHRWSATLRSRYGAQTHAHTRRQGMVSSRSRSCSHSAVKLRCFFFFFFSGA